MGPTELRAQERPELEPWKGRGRKDPPRSWEGSALPTPGLWLPDSRPREHAPVSSRPRVWPWLLRPSNTHTALHQSPGPSASRWVSPLALPKRGPHTGQLQHGICPLAVLRAGGQDPAVGRRIPPEASPWRADGCLVPPWSSLRVSVCRCPLLRKTSVLLGQGPPVTSFFLNHLLKAPSPRTVPF